MDHWTHIPMEMGNKRGFTSVTLPEDKIKKDLESLPPPPKLRPLIPRILELQKQFATRAAAPAVLAANLVPRRDQKSLTVEEAGAYKSAVQQLVNDGTYQTLALVHADMSHNMHGSMGPIGLLRFLPWHRRFIAEFERQLVAIDKKLRPNAPAPIALPYWSWPDPFPAWLQGFLPAPDPNTGNPPDARTETAPPPKPAQPDVDYIMNGYRNQVPNIGNINDYVRFTYGLEGWGKRANGTPLPAHNNVHDWVGGIMGDIMYSPMDPVFWIHHAEVDRLWDMWQRQHPGIDSPLTGKDAILDPWPETYADVRATEALGYVYV